MGLGLVSLPIFLNETAVMLVEEENARRSRCVGTYYY
jgi:hypothetical protein